MKYNLDNLNPYDFEKLVQALSRKIIGNGTITFGDGTDGGREATFQGTAPAYPSTRENWDGYWVVQSKYKSGKDEEFSWVKTQLDGEFKKFRTRKIKVKKPEHYLLFTNCNLSAKPGTGGRDKVTALEREAEKKYGINHIRIISYDDISDFLHLYRDIAISFAPFILSGDVLSKLLDMLDYKHDRIKRVNEIVSRFVEVEFREDAQSKLDHAGKLTTDKVNLEKVFIDLSVSPDEIIEKDPFKFIDHVIRVGNTILKDEHKKESRFVLVAGPGYGKSTLTQFLVQIFRAFFLKSVANTSEPNEEVKLFIDDYSGIIQSAPKWVRLPVKIVLKEYAGWIKENVTSSSPKISILNYLQYNIEKKTSSKLAVEEIETIIDKLPCLFIFDGLDEVPASSNRDMVLAEIYNFTDTVLRRVSSDSIIISTTRPKGYSSEFDITKYQHLNILDMNQNECKLYLSRLVDNIIDDIDTRKEKLRILATALSDKVVSRIMKSPLQASIMAILVKSGGEPPTNKFDLFAEYFSIIFTREKQRNILPILATHPTYVKEIHNILGLYLQAISERNTNPSATIDSVEFQLIIKKYLVHMGHSDLDIDNFTKNIWEASTDRLVFISHLQDEKIGFAIRALQEFFAALGYIHNVRDEVICERIRAISLNAYWSNTLLFVIGYISKEKKYLVDFVESICNEMNGSADDKDNLSLSSIPKLGSWLALDILNEGIFKENPRIENKFWRLIYPLFNLPITSKHRELFKLSESITSRWLKETLESKLSEDNNNLTAWNILINFEDSGFDLGELFERHWPEHPDDQFKVIEIFIAQNYYNKYSVKKLIELVNEENKNLIIKLVKQESSPIVIQALKISKSRRLKGILFEIYLLQYFDRFYSSDNRSVFEFFGFKLNEDENIKQELNKLKNVVNIDVVDGYRIEIIKTKLNNTPFLKQIIRISKEYDSKLLQALFNFLINPSNQTFSPLATEIELQTLEYKKHIKSNLKIFNTFFSRYFESEEKKCPIQVDTEIEEIEKEDKELILSSRENLSLFFEKQYHKYAITINHILDKLQEYETRYSDIKGSLIYRKMFFRLFSTAITYSNSEDFAKIAGKKEWIKIYEDLVLNTDFASQLRTITFINSLFLFELKEMHALVSRFEKYSKAGIAYSFKNHFFERQDAVNQEVMKKISALLRMQMLLKERPSFNLLFQLAIKVLEHSTVESLLELPYEEIIDSDERDIYAALILIIDQKFAKRHLDCVIAIFSDNAALLMETKHIDAIVFVLRYVANNEWIDKLYLFLNKNITFTQMKQQTLFFELIKTYIGEKPSKVDLDKLEII